MGLTAVLRRLMLAAMAASIVLFSPRAGGAEVHRVGVLVQSETPEQTEAWPQALREHGWIIGQNIQLEYRYYSDRFEDLPTLAAELAALNPEVIVAVGTTPALAVRAAAPTVPLIFFGVGNPIGLGLADSFAHPGGNATGIAAVVFGGFTRKQLQLLKELVPQASRIAVLANPKNPGHQRDKPGLEEIGRQLGVILMVV